MSVSIVSLNARGLRDNVKRKALFLYAKSFKTDFCFFQESHSVSNDISFWKNQWGNEVWMAHGSEHSAGVMIVKNHFAGSVLQSYIDPMGHFLILVICINNIFVLLVNIYGYNTSRENDLLLDEIGDKILLWFNKFPDAVICIGGDFNITPDNNLDRFPPRQSTSPNLKLKMFMEKLDLVDIWREKFPNTKSYTWGNKSRSRLSRLDYWLVPYSFKDYNVSVSILPSPLTDHHTILLSTPLSTGHSNINSRASYWKMNSSLLKHDELKKRISFLIRYYWVKASSEKKFSLNWDLLKYEVGMCIRHFSSILAKQRRDEEEKVISKIITLQSKIQESLSETDLTELTELQSKLDNIYKYKAEGSYVRSRRKWLEQGEQSSAYFFRMEKHNSRNLSISSLQINGILTDNSKDIASFCSNFYSKLYKSNYCKDSASLFFQSLKEVKSISKDEQLACDKTITISEVIEGIEGLKNNKSPGTDGLTAEFYKNFAEELAPFLLKMFLESIQSETLPSSLTQGLLTLIPKPKKDTTLIDNWRPICLLNNDYKILAWALAKRLKCVLSSVIDETQSGFMPKRHIANNIRLVLDLLDYSELVVDDSLILFLDFYKAFDSLEHEFIFLALQKLGFGDPFCKFIRTLYNNANCSINLKSGTSPRFQLSRGVRQGCPVSPYLFLVAAQLLSSFLLSTHLQGITIANKHILISQLADDTTLFLKDELQIPIAIQHIKVFSKASGLNLNLNKCELLAIKTCPSLSLYGIPVKSQVTYLGISICKDDKVRCRLNFDPVVGKAKRKFNSWLQRDLSLRGRTLIAKAEGISRMTYPALSLYVDKAACADIDRMLFDFLWKHKRHYIKKSVIINNYECGGLNFLDFASLNNTFKINWLKQYLINPDSFWNTLPSLVFSKVGGLPFLLLCNYNITKLPLKLSNFHKQALLAWHLIYKHNFSPHRYFIWNNCDIIYKNKSLFFPNWVKNNLILVSQLINTDGYLYSYSEFLNKYNIPVTPREFAIVMDAIPYGAITLLRDSARSQISLSVAHPFDTTIGNICFLSNSCSRNRKIRQLFQNEIVSLPYIVSYWNGQFVDIPWKKVWTLSSKYLITNKVKDVSYKLLHLFYPVKLYLKKMFPDIDTLCSFCGAEHESISHLFWECTYTSLFWKNFCIFVHTFSSQSFSLLYKDVLFGQHNFDKNVKDQYFLINLFIFLAKFFIHKCKFQDAKPYFFIFYKELKSYLDTLSTSSNSKALKTVSLCHLHNILLTI